MEEKDKREITDTETLREKIRELEEALEAERALDDVAQSVRKTTEPQKTPRSPDGAVK